jgi:hypothetical protein
MSVCIEMGDETLLLLSFVFIPFFSVNLRLDYHQDLLRLGTYTEIGNKP